MVKFPSVILARLLQKVDGRLCARHVLFWSILIAFCLNEQNVQLLLNFEFVHT
jgi:hypothetical protein